MMKKLLWVVVATMVLGIGLMAGSAFADRSEVQCELNIIKKQAECQTDFFLSSATKGLMCNYTVQVYDSIHFTSLGEYKSTVKFEEKHLVTKFTLALSSKQIESLYSTLISGKVKIHPDTCK